MTLDQPRADIDRGLRARRFLGYRESAEWASQAGPTVAEFRDAVDSGPSSELVMLVERATAHVVKAILHADDSDGSSATWHASCSITIPAAVEVAEMDCDQSRRSPRRVSKVQQEPECPGDGEERFVARSTKTSDEPVL